MDRWKDFWGIREPIRLDGSLIDIILRPTLRGQNLITGRQILDKARACVMEAKKLLGFWMEFLVDDHFPSGMSHDDASEYVLGRARDESSIEVDEDDAEGLLSIFIKRNF